MEAVDQGRKLWIKADGGVTEIYLEMTVYRRSKFLLTLYFFQIIGFTKQCNLNVGILCHLMEQSRPE